MEAKLDGLEPHCTVPPSHLFLLVLWGVPLSFFLSFTSFFSPSLRMFLLRGKNEQNKASGSLSQSQPGSNDMPSANDQGFG